MCISEKTEAFMDRAVRGRLRPGASYENSRVRYVFEGKNKDGTARVSVHHRTGTDKKGNPTYEKKGEKRSMYSVTPRAEKPAPKPTKKPKAPKAPAKKTPAKKAPTTKKKPSKK